MNKKSMVVVGDRFAHFGSLEGATTVSNLAARFDGAASEAEPTRFVVGQGVSESWSQYLRARAMEKGMEAEFVTATPLSGRTGRNFAHKHRRHNILITDPKECAPLQYLSRLVIDDECELMTDHTTGHHLQGMLLIEAARQSFLAVTERFLLESKEKHYFVINDLQVKFNKFAFPISTDIEIDVSDVNRSRQDRLSARATVRFIQQGECVTVVSFAYTAMLESTLQKREAEMAIQALQHELTVGCSQVRLVEAAIA
jgi:hypothetical protein